MSEPNVTKFVPRDEVLYALCDSALATSNVFTSVAHGQRLARVKCSKSLEPSKNRGISKLVWDCAGGQLGRLELRLLLVLLALAARGNEVIEAPAATEAGETMLRELNAAEAPRGSEHAYVQVSWSRLLRLCGYTDDSGSSYTAVKDALDRLHNTTLWVHVPYIENGRPAERAHAYRLLSISWFDTSYAGSVQVAFNWRLSEALFGTTGATWALVSLQEQDKLDSALAQLLHFKICGVARPNKPWTWTLGELVGLMYVDKATGSTLRSRRADIKKALTEIKTKLKWDINVYKKDGVAEVRVRRGAWRHTKAEVAALSTSGGTPTPDKAKKTQQEGAT